MTRDQSSPASGPAAGSITTTPCMGIGQVPAPRTGDTTGEHPRVGLPGDEVGRVEVRTGTKGRLIASLTSVDRYWVMQADDKSVLHSSFANGLRALLAAVSPQLTPVDPPAGGVHVGDVTTRAGDLYPSDVGAGAEG
jgi:hypothetical protein